MKLTMLVMVAVVLAGCGPDFQSAEEGTDELGSSTAELATTVTVKIVGAAFSPASVTVKKGTKVKFVNASPMGHTVTSGTGSQAANAGAAFDKSLAPGKSVSLTFNTVGQVRYFCRPHEAMGMKGVVIVTP